jgi:hypothetical protein
MNHKSLFISLFSTFLAGSAFAAPAMQLGDGIQLHLLGDVEYVYDDNILRQGEGAEQSAQYLTFTPGVELRFMERGAASATVSYRHSIDGFRDLNELNDDYSDLRAKAKYNSGRLMVSAHGSYRETSSTRQEFSDLNEAIPGLVHRDEIKLGGDVRYEISELLAASTGVMYEDRDYEDRDFTDYQSYSIPVTLIYKWKPKLELNAGVQYRITDSDSSDAFVITDQFGMPIGIEPRDFDYEDIYYFVGARGELFTPVLFADVSVGFLERDFKDWDTDASSTSYNVTLTYVGDAKTTVYLTLSRDYNTSAFRGNNYSLTKASLGARYALTDKIGFRASASAGELDYDVQFNPSTGELVGNRRASDLMTYSVGAYYSPNEYLRFNADYTFNDVERKGGNSPEYDNSRFRVSASVRY